MRTLKKTLALVLALVMCFGIFAVSASAVSIEDFSDTDKIGATYTEAVDVLTGLGIIAGMDDGSFQPEATLTREQGAKLIAYLMLGATAADALTTTAAPFSDVPATRWSAGYIAYCANEGLINGYGNGKFGPADTLTGLQFAKMLLSAVGYGAKNEFVGDSWAIEVAKVALKADVFKGNTAGANNQPCTRQAACLYTFNTMTRVPQVTYSELLGEYTSGGALGTFASSTIAEDLYDLYVTNMDGTNIDYTVVSAKYYNRMLNASINNFAETLAPETATIYLDFNTPEIGRAGYVWITPDEDALGDYKVISNVYYTDNVLKTVYAEADSALYSGKFSNWANKSSFAYVAPADAAVQVYVNGISGKVDTDVVKGCVSTIIDSDKNGSFDKVVSIKATADRVTDAIKTKVTAGVTQVSIPGVTTGSAYVTAEGYENLAKDDVILYYVRPDGVWVIEELTAIAGTYNNATMLMGIIPGYVFEGKTYYASQLPGTDVSNTENTKGVMFLDKGGNVVYGYDVDEPLSDFVYVLDTDTAVLAGDSTYYAKLLFADGTRSTVVTKIDYSAAATLPADRLAGHFATYVKSETTGKYTLTGVAAPITETRVTTNTATVVTGAAVFTTGFKANSNTVFVAYDSTDDAWTVTTGLSKSPAATNAQVYSVNDKNGYATFVYITSANITGGGTTAYFIKNASYSSFAATATTPAYKAIPAIVDGELVTLKVLAGVTLQLGLRSITYDGSGYVNSIGASAADLGGMGTDSAVLGTVTLGTGTYTYSSSTEVWVINFGSATKGTIDDIAADDATDTWEFVLKTGTVDELETVYLVKEGTSTTDLWFYNSPATPFDVAGTGTTTDPYTQAITLSGAVGDPVAFNVVGWSTTQTIALISGSLPATFPLADATYTLTYKVTAETGEVAYYVFTITLNV